MVDCTRFSCAVRRFRSAAREGRRGGEWDEQCLVWKVLAETGAQISCSHNHQLCDAVNTTNDVLCSKGNATHDLEATPSQPLVNRRLHWTISRGGHWNIRITPFDSTDEQFGTVPVAEYMDLRKGRNHQVELGGCLSAAVPSLSGALEIWVMKESWIKDYSIGTYLPKGLQNHEHEEYNDPSCKISRILMRKRYGLHVRVLGMLRNGKILLEYHNRALVLYEPDRDEAIDLMLEGLPEWFESIVHVSSINRM